MMRVSAAPPQTRPRFVVDAARARALVEACGGTLSPGQVAAGLAPPQAAAIGTLVLGVQPIVSTLLQAQPFGSAGAGIIMHRQEHMLWHRPLRLDCPYTVAAELMQHEARRAGTFLQVGVTLIHPQEGAAVSTVSHLFVPPNPHKAGADALVVAAKKAATGCGPSPSAPPGVATLPSWQVPSDGPERYAKASLETNPIHLDDQKAQAAGLPKRVLHGMCSLGFAAQALLTYVAAMGPKPKSKGDGAATDAAPKLDLTALSARFSHPVFCQDVLTCRVHALTQSAQSWQLVFDVVQQQGVVVLSRGNATFAQTAD